jgi:hypothetical protein
MLTRRELLARGTTVLLLVPIVGCTTSSDPTTVPVPSCAGTTTRSSVDAAHTHTVCVLNTDLSSPPAAGVSYTTSTDGGHTHQVTLTKADLTAINAGQQMMVTSTSDVDPGNGSPHTHKFSITKGDTGGGGSGDPGGGGW